MTVRQQLRETLRAVGARLAGTRAPAEPPYVWRYCPVCGQRRWMRPPWESAGPEWNRCGQCALAASLR